MESGYSCHARLVAAIVVLAFVTNKTAEAQLEITEIMFDSVAEEPKWEWIEIRNAGAFDIDLDGYFLDDVSSGSALRAANISATVLGENLVETTVPVGRVAVLYNGRNLDFMPARFRAAWNLADTVRLIGVDGWPSLNNGGDAIGLWPDLQSYTSDLANTDEDEDLEVARFDNSLTWLDYREGFPSPTGASIEWSGEGDFRAAANWFAATDDSSSVSFATALDDQTINSIEDFGNPGSVLGTGEASSLVITELMYNPASDEPDWEWVEIFNGTGATIDFTENPHYLDDLAGGALSQPNIDSGRLEDGGIAVLFRDELTVDSMKAAWGEEVRFIPVGSWPSLNNGGDLIGIWNGEADYLADSVAGQDRIDTRAVTAVSYADGTDDWPDVENGNSISLLDLDGDPNDPTNWSLSQEGDGVSRFAKAVITSQPDHVGGDVGTPGIFGEAEVACVIPRDGLLGDLDRDGAVGFSDFLILSNNFSKTVSTYEEGDLDCDGSVAFADFLSLSDNYGRSESTVSATVPEPSAALILVTSILTAAMAIRGRKRP